MRSRLLATLVALLLVPIGITLAPIAQAQAPASARAAASLTKTPTKLGLDQGTTIVTRGKGHPVTGRLTTSTGVPLTKVVVTLWAGTHGVAGCFQQIERATVTGGKFRFPLTPTGYDDYQVRYAGDSTYGASSSRTVYFRTTEVYGPLEDYGLDIYTPYGQSGRLRVRGTPGTRVNLSSQKLLGGPVTTFASLRLTEQADGDQQTLVRTPPVTDSSRIVARTVPTCVVPPQAVAGTSWVRLFDTVSYSLTKDGQLTVTASGKPALVGGRIFQIAAFEDFRGPDPSMYKKYATGHVPADGKLKITFDAGALDAVGPGYRDVQVRLPAAHGKTASREEWQTVSFQNL